MFESAIFETEDLALLKIILWESIWKRRRADKIHASECVFGSLITRGQVNLLYLPGAHFLLGYFLSPGVWHRTLQFNFA